MMEVDRLHRASFASGGYDLDIFDESEMRIEKYKCVVVEKYWKMPSSYQIWIFPQGHALPVTQKISGS